MTGPDGAARSDTERYWAMVAAETLPYQRCRACGEADFPPGSLCRFCGGTIRDWQKSEGDGTVITWTRIERTGDPAFQPLLPYVVAVVALDEGFSVLAGLDPIDAAEVGARCRAGFRRSPATGVLVPHFEVTS